MNAERIAQLSAFIGEAIAQDARQQHLYGVLTVTEVLAALTDVERRILTNWMASPCPPSDLWRASYGSGGR